MITDVAFRLVHWPIEPRGAARRMWRERTALIIAVRDDSGATGLGEAAPLPGMSIDTVEDAERAARALAAQVPFALDTPAHATGIADRLTTAPAARFAIESALLSALAQRSRTSVAALWGKVPQAELRVAPVIDEASEGRGARCVKIKAEHPARVIELARDLPGVRLRVDANRQWTPAMLEQMRGLLIDYVEEPCPDAHELLARELPCKIALDESLVALSRAELARALESPQLAALVLKPTLLGGFARCFELAAQAHHHGVAPITSHALEGRVGFAACVELARAIGADVPIGLAPHVGLVSC